MITVEIPKQNIPNDDIFKDTYFDTLKNSNVGSKNDICTLDLDEATIMNIPYIDIKNVLDRTLVNKNKFVDSIIHMLCEIDGINLIDEKQLYKFDKQLCFKYIKQKIMNSDDYNFNNILSLKNDELNKFVLLTKDKKGNRLITYCVDRHNFPLLYVLIEKKNNIVTQYFDMIVNNKIDVGIENQNDIIEIVVPNHDIDYCYTMRIKKIIRNIENDFYCLRKIFPYKCCKRVIKYSNLRYHDKLNKNLKKLEYQYDLYFNVIQEINTMKKID